MLKIQRSANEHVVYTVSGRMDEEHIAGLETLIRSEANGRRIVLDLKNLTLVNQDAISFLERCEANGITLENCPAYIREWINGQRRGS
jgi:anti-anti-sigma regulatory factor